MTIYALDVQTNSTSQSEPVRGKNMIQNRAGGYGFEIDKWTRLERFLILGHEGGTYYATQKELSLESVTCLDECISEDAYKTVKTIADISLSGRAPKNDSAIFALAYCVSKGGLVSDHALHYLKEVCRIGTHLFRFLEDLKTLGRGWGRGLRRAVADWYLSKNSRALSLQLTKYARRHGWSHRDALRKCHAKTNDPELNSVLNFATHCEEWSGDSSFLQAVKSVDATNVVRLIQEHGLVREHVPTELLGRADVWEALLENMPMTAMIRNLGKMSNVGLLRPLTPASKLVCDKLGDVQALRKSRVHSVTLLIARKTYALGRGILGKLQWIVDQHVVSALDSAFYSSFANVTPTGKSFLLGVDVSGSMSQSCGGSPILSCCEAAGVMAMITAKTENSHILGFCGELVDLGITGSDSLEAVCLKCRRNNFGRTNCSLPMSFAENNNLDVDVFCVYTDNETWCGDVHPFQSLRQYRKFSGRSAKLAVFGMANTNFSIADPNDSGMMDFVGFDAASPMLLGEFAKS